MAVAAATTAIAAYGAYSANRQAGKSRRAQQGMHDQQMGLAQEGMEFGRQHYDWSRGLHDDYRQRFDPVLGELTTEAMANRTPDYGAISADARAAFDGARMADQRNLARYGIRPGDGQWGATERRYGIGRAAAEVGARQQARRQNEDARYNRLAQLYGVGMGLQGQAMSGMGQGMSMYQGAAGGGMNAAGQQAGYHGQQAAYHNQMAGQNMMDLGYGIGGMFGGGGQQPFGEPSYGGYDSSGMPWPGTNKPGDP